MNAFENEFVVPTGGTVAADLIAQMITGHHPPPDPEMIGPAPAENEEPGDIVTHAEYGPTVAVMQSESAEFSANTAVAESGPEQTGAEEDEAVGSEHPLYVLERDLPMSRRSKPDFELPIDSNGLPYGPMGFHRTADPQHANLWDDALAWWMKHEAMRHEASTVRLCEEYRKTTWGRINMVRAKKDPAMPTFSNIDYKKIPYTLGEIEALWPSLNEDEQDLIGTRTVVAETDPRYPSKTDCYCPRSGSYWHRVKGRWCAFNKDQYVTQLVAEGYDGGSKNSASRGTQVSEIVRKVAAKQIRIAGAWSGHAEGLHTARNGSYYLCTKDSPIPKLETGDFDHLGTYLCVLLGEGVDIHYAMQMRLFLAWMRHAITALQSRDTECPSRLLVFAGAHGDGKSTLVSKVIHTAFGGRTVSAKLMMSGKTGFNSELAEAELLTFDDIPNNLSPMETANTLKTFLVGHELGMLVHPKGQDAATIPVLHRLVWCCNNDANALKHLPKMRRGDGLIDKVITLQTHKTALSGMRGDAAKLYRNKLAEQVPAFLDWLMSPAVEEALDSVPRDGRGPEAWMHPDIEAELLDQSAEQHLAGMLRSGDELALWDQCGNTVQSIDMQLSRLYPGRYERLIGGSPVRLGLMLAALATDGVIAKAPKSPKCKIANKWLLAGIAEKQDKEE